MEKQADKQRKTHGKATNHTTNKDKQQNNTKKLLRHKAGILDQARRLPH